MKIDRFVKAMLVLIVILLALNCATNLKSPVDAQGGAKFSYLHLVGPVVDQVSGRSVSGLGVIDLRNGNEWILPDTGEAIYLRKHNFEALDNAPIKKP